VKTSRSKRPKQRGLSRSQLNELLADLVAYAGRIRGFRKLFTALVERYLARRVDAIRLGCAPVWGNDASAYQVAVPKKFAEQFRRMRNAHSHVSVHRIQSTRDWSLTEFYDRCHRFVMVLFQDAHSWGYAGELGNVDSFSVAGRGRTGQS
jgi:hypothetical protein